LRLLKLGAADAATLHAAAAVIRTWVLVSPKPFALLHGDYRLDNLMFGDDPQDVVALDWQTIGVGPPARDLAYFLGTGLTAELRREAEQELVAGYHCELLRRAIEGYDVDQCFRDYRLGQLQATMITTIGCIYALRQLATKVLFGYSPKRSTCLRTSEQLLFNGPYRALFGVIYAYQVFRRYGCPGGFVGGARSIAW